MQEWGLTYPEYQSHDPPQGTDGLRYGVVRNPWVRMLSLYRMMYPDGQPREYRAWVAQGLQARPDLPPHIAYPASYWLQDADLVLRYETLNGIRLATLATLLDRPMPSVRRPSAVRLHRWYDSETVRRVAEHSGVDIEEYGYTFPPRTSASVASDAGL